MTRGDDPVQAVGRAADADRSRGPMTLAWIVMAGLGAALLITAAALGLALGGPADAWPALLLGWPVVGGVLVLKRPDNAVGKVLILYGTPAALSTMVELYLHVGLTHRPLPATDLAVWVSAWAFTPGGVVLALLVAVFPSGRVTSWWLRWVLWLGLVVTVLLVAIRMVVPVPIPAPSGQDLLNPWAIVALAPLVPVEEVLGWGVLLAPVLAMADLVARWRRSRGVERLQMRWLALVAAVFVFAVVITSSLRLIGLPEELLEVADSVGWLSGLALVPVAIGVAVTRYRLYEIDRILSRTVSYTVVVGVLVTVYAGGVFLLSGLLPLEGEVAVAASTLAVAALFNPLRRRVRDHVDRRFNRSRYDVEQVLTQFEAALRDRVALDDVVDGWVAAVASAMQPSLASVWITTGGHDLGTAARAPGADLRNDSVPLEA